VVSHFVYGKGGQRGGSRNKGARLAEGHQGTPQIGIAATKQSKTSKRGVGGEQSWVLEKKRKKKKRGTAEWVFAKRESANGENSRTRKGRSDGKEGKKNRTPKNFRGGGGGAWPPLKKGIFISVKGAKQKSRDGGGGKKKRRTGLPKSGGGRQRLALKQGN